jgi:hypothetical protein
MGGEHTRHRSIYRALLVALAAMLGARFAAADESKSTGPTAPESNFPPADFAPPSERSAGPGDGHWVPLGAMPSKGEPAVFAKTVVHPHPKSKWVTVTIAAIDLGRVRIGFVPGTDDLEWAKQRVTEGAGTVPAPARDGLLAVMNGGFQPKHGRWGMMAEGVIVAPPREEGCTLALYRDGTARLGPWRELSATVQSMTSYRQTPPCLLESGALHPDLPRGRDRAWAGHVTDLTTRRRSAAGIDASGRILFYAIGEEADPRWLAEGLRLAGATTALELDINWYWTRFLLFGRDEQGSLHVEDTLIPKMEHLDRGYVERPSTRDFFYFY